MNQNFVAFSVTGEQFGKVAAFDPHAVERDDHIAWGNTDPLCRFFVINLTYRKAGVIAEAADAEKLAFGRRFRLL